MSNAARSPSDGAVPAAEVAVWATSTRSPAESPGAQRSIRVFCWPEVPHAWPRLGEAVSVAGQRFSQHVTAGDRSWLSENAPQFFASLHADETIAEATLAAMVMRLPVRLTMARFDSPVGRPVSIGARCRSLFVECMAPYAAYLKRTNQKARVAAVSAGVDDQTRKAQADAFMAVLPLMEEGERLAPMQLRYWSSEPLPLPLELAHVMAEGVARHLDDPHRVSPLWDAMRTKLVGDVRWVGSSGRRRK